MGKGGETSDIFTVVSINRRGKPKAFLNPYAERFLSDGALLFVRRGIAYPVAHMGDSQRVALLKSLLAFQ